MIVSVTLNPSVDRAIFVQEFKFADTNRVSRTETDAGGKGINLARVAVEMGAEALATGFIGGGTGAFIQRVLDKEGVPHSFVEISGETRLNISIEDERDQPPTTLNEEGPQIEHQAWLLLLSKIEEIAKRATWVTIGGSLPPGVPIDAYRVIAEISRASNTKIVLDADGEALRFGLGALPDLIKPNAKEASRFLGINIATLDDGVIAARELRKFVASDGIVIVSMGDLGAVMSLPDETILGIPPQVQVRSTIGSGDSLLGGMLAALERGSNIIEAFLAGIAAGAATAMTDGCSIAKLKEVNSLQPQVMIKSINN